MWAIRVDGVVIQSGACGEDFGPRVNDGGSGSRDYGPGLHSVAEPVVVEALIDIDPGTHTVELVGYTSLHSLPFDAAWFPGNLNAAPYVFNHELIIRELRA
jgi:hypothetical protein